MQKTKKEAKLYGKKALVLACALTMAATAGVGGTLAWLIAKTDEVVNTFTYGDIDITLEETDTMKDDDNTDLIGPDGNPVVDDENPNTNIYEMVPGTDIKKDPTITVEGDSEACWLFVKLDKANKFDDFMSYAMGEGWTALDGVAGVYYQQTEYSADDQQFTVIKDNKVTVKSNIKKSELNELTADTYPTLTVTAYAVQLASIETAAEAWELAQDEAQY